MDAMNAFFDFWMFFFAIGFIACLFAISFLRALPRWIADRRELAALKDEDIEPVICWSTPAPRKLIKADLMAMGYSSEVIDSVRRIWICRHKARLEAKKVRVVELVEHLKTKDAVREMRKNVVRIKRETRRVEPLRMAA